MEDMNPYGTLELHIVRLERTIAQHMVDYFLGKGFMDFRHPNLGYLIAKLVPHAQDFCRRVLSIPPSAYALRARQRFERARFEIHQAHEVG
jgi:hypothetical protein